MEGNRHGTDAARPCADGQMLRGGGGGAVDSSTLHLPRAWSRLAADDGENSSPPSFPSAQPRCDKLLPTQSNQTELLPAPFFLSRGAWSSCCHGPSLSEHWNSLSRATRCGAVLTPAPAGLAPSSLFRHCSCFLLLPPSPAQALSSYRSFSRLIDVRRSTLYVQSVRGQW